MKKQFLFAALIAAAAISCNKKEETGAITATETTTTAPETTTVVNNSDSATTATTTATTEQTTATKTTTGAITNYVSTDGKTNFSVIFDNDKHTAAVKNEATGKTYEMNSVTSASGTKYADKDGNFFWEHHGDFTFGNGDKEEVTGKKK